MTLRLSAEKSSGPSCSTTSVEQIPRSSKKVALRILEVPIIGDVKETASTLSASPFLAAQEQAAKIACCIEAHKEEWFAKARAAHSSIILREKEIPRDLLVTEDRIVMLPKTEDPIIGEGTFKEVRKGVDITAGKIVAVAEIIIPLEQKQTLLCTRKEIEICKRLQGRVEIVNTIATHEMTQEELVQFTIVQELAESDLFTALVSGALQPEDRQQIALDILEGLAYLHDNQRLLHRDMKPENCLLFTDPQTGRKRAKLTDFGFACAISDLEKRKNIAVGTSVYYAPEQAVDLFFEIHPELKKPHLSKDFSSEQTDVYITGLVLGQLFNEQGFPWEKAFSEGDFDQLYRQMAQGWKPDVPPAVRPIIHQMLERNPAKRPTARQALDQMLKLS